MRHFEVLGENGVEVKRFYIPIIIDVPCTKCGEVCKHDFSDKYLMYPTINKPESVGVFCEKCDDHFNVNVTLRMSLDVSVQVDEIDIQDVPYNIGEHNQLLNDVQALFNPMFNLAPTNENLIPIMEKFREAFISIESLKK